MYNLLVTAVKGQWNRGAYDLSRDRFHEYTDEETARLHASLGDKERAALRSMPSLFLYERGIVGGARLGRLTQIRARDHEIRIEFEIDSSLPSFRHSKIAGLKSELDINGGEFTRTHWAVKDVDLLAVLVRKRCITSEQAERYARTLRTGGALDTRSEPSLLVRPIVFRIPTVAVDAELVSVMLPFSEEFRPVLENIRAACRSVGLNCKAVDDIWEESEIVQDVFSLIYQSKVIVCDLSGRNANVFYEAGIAHTLGRHVIPIVQVIDDIPFDLRHHRHIEYENNVAGLRLLEQRVAARLKTIIGLPES